MGRLNFFAMSAYASWLNETFVFIESKCSRGYLEILGHLSDRPLSGCSACVGNFHCKSPAGKRCDRLGCNDLSSIIVR